MSDQRPDVVHVPHVLRRGVFGELTEDPVGELVSAVRRNRVEAVFVPGLEHFDGIAPWSLVAVADVITVSLRHTYARWSTGQLPAEVEEV